MQNKKTYLAASALLGSLLLLPLAAPASAADQNFVDHHTAELLGYHALLDDSYHAATGHSVQKLLDGLGHYEWSMFLSDEGLPHPDIDVNNLIHNVWYLDYVGTIRNQPAPDGLTRSKRNEFHEYVRFQPISFGKQDTIKSTPPYWLVMNVLSHIDNEDSQPTNYLNENFTLAWNPAGGDFKTIRPSLYHYKYRKGRGPNDFWIMEYYDGQPTKWAYHLTKAADI